MSLALITQLIRAAAAALEIYAAREARREEIDLEDDERELHSLRDRGDPDSQRRADWLRQRIARGRGIVARAVPASGPAPAGGQGSADAGRDSHTSNG